MAYTVRPPKEKGGIMTAKQRVICVKEFAEAMLEFDSNFADRVGHFEENFGATDADMLAVLAQATYFCWYIHDYESNLILICRAISAGKPTAFHLCFQVGPERWAAVNSYVIGIQRWLGVDLPLPSQIDSEKIEQIAQWLGGPNMAKETLAKLYLAHTKGDLLMNHLMNTGLAKMGKNTAPKNMEEYTDLTSWWPGFVWDTAEDKASFIEKCKQLVYREMAGAEKDAKELISGILKYSQPPCMYRFTRYQDIKISSIGALKWRGNIPADNVPNVEWQTFHDGAIAALHAWLDGVSPDGKLALKIYEALGTPTDRSKTIVRNFLIEEGRWNEGGFGPGLINCEWLVWEHRRRGITADLTFRGRDEGIPYCAPLYE